jgi:hypothetical protein
MYSRIPTNFRIDKYHRESVKFLRNEGIYSLHFMDKATREAQLILTNLRARPIIETLLLGRIDAKTVAKRTNARLTTHLSAEGVEAYSLYYWNVTIMKVEDWARLFEQSHAQRQQTLAVVQAGPAMALHKMGFAQQIEGKVVLKEVFDGLYFDFKEWQTQPLSLDKTRALTANAKAIAGIDDRLSQADSALADSLKQFEQFRMQHASQVVPAILDIAPSGNFTDSGAKLLESGTQEEANEHSG